MKIKQQSLYHFNPGHDLALANNSATFVPPKAVQQMQYDLSLLPLWYAAEDGIVLSDQEEADEFIYEIVNLLPSFSCYKPKAMSVPAFSELMSHIDSTLFDVCPWGWDRAEKAYLNRSGVPVDCMPSVEMLDAIRMLSSRCRAVELLPCLRVSHNYIGESSFLTTLDSCLDYTKSHSACVFKAPLSGSGKGLNWYRDGVFSSPFERWFNRQCSMQGGVVAEPMYNKVQDMAVEILLRKGRASFAGYSFFNTTPTGVYRNNRLLPDTFDAEKSYMQSINSELLPVLLQEIERMFGEHYDGYLGVDMMICTDDTGNSMLIHPCVEVNARMTMGIFARVFYDRYIYSGCRGEFHVDYHRQSGDAVSFHRLMLDRYPVEIRDGRLYKGYLSLTPVNSQTRSQAWAVVG